MWESVTLAPWATSRSAMAAMMPGGRPRRRTAHSWARREVGCARGRGEAGADEGAGLQGPAPKEHFDKYHERVRRGSPNFVYEIVRACTSLYAWVFFRLRSEDSRTRCPSPPGHPRAEPLQPHGPLLHRRGHPPPRAVHGQVAALQRPVMQYIYNPGGVFPVRRGVAGRGGVHLRVREGLSSAAWSEDCSPGRAPGRPCPATPTPRPARSPGGRSARRASISPSSAWPAAASRSSPRTRRRWR